MSEINTLLKQSSHYFAGRLLIMLAGFVSFPILTRIFSVGDYGILGLLNTTLFIVIALSKLGLQESIVRFYAEFKLKNKLNIFYSTLFLGSVSIAAIAALFFYIISQLMRNILDKNIINLLFLVSLLIFTRCTITILISFLRADQRTKLYNLVAALSRYGSLALSIFLVLFFMKGLYGFYAGQIIWSITILCVLLYVFRGQIKLGLAYFSPTILKQSIKFGFPLVWAELGHLFLNYADRYLILLYLSSTYLGLYTAGYNLATYATEAIVYPINYARPPISMDMLARKREEELKEFLTKSFRYFLLILIPVVFGFMALGKDLITFLASAKYVEAYTILPYVIIGQSIYACSLTLNAGLFIRKKTHMVLILMIFACLVNLGLNIILIPRFGIIGAAQATLVAYIIYTVIITYFAFKEFSFKIEFERILLYVSISLVMSIIVRNIHFGPLPFNIACKVIIGVIVYSLLAIAFDRELRNKCIAVGTRIINRSRETYF